MWGKYYLWKRARVLLRGTREDEESESVKKEGPPLGRIAQGWGNTKRTDTVRFMTHEEIAEIPEDRVVTYARIVCNY